MLTGIIGFVLGRVLSGCKFYPGHFPYRLYHFEKDGTIYEKIKIRKWQNKVIDMSRIFPSLMPTKKLDKDICKKLPILIKETCISEMIHYMLCISGLYCLVIWEGIGGVIVTLIYEILGNLPYIIIQRYNRPRLTKLLKRYKQRDQHLKAKYTEGEKNKYEYSDIELQHG